MTNISRLIKIMSACQWHDMIMRYKFNMIKMSLSSTWSVTLLCIVTIALIKHYGFPIQALEDVSIEVQIIANMHCVCVASLYIQIYHGRNAPPTSQYKCFPNGSNNYCWLPYNWQSDDSSTCHHLDREIDNLTKLECCIYKIKRSFQCHTGPAIGTQETSKVQAMAYRNYKK